MAARRESGTPSAQTVLEVADGLRWTDPALGVSLAEHARRMAGDDPAIHAAAERSILRSLTEADRYDEVVTRSGPLLDEARERGDRDDGAAVVVELASAALGLGDGAAAWTLVERLPPADELPARIAAAAALIRTRVRADNGDVVGADGESERAVSALLRVPEPEAGLLRREMTCARVRARRRAGDPAGALALLSTAVTDDPRNDADGGRRSLAAAAEQIELLVELGRPDEAVARARELVPHGPVAPALLRAVSRIRLVLAERGAGDPAETRGAAQGLEDAGHLDDAARAWQVVAAAAEARGELGEALAALRHGHALESRAREEHQRSLRRVATVEVGDLLVARRDAEPTPPAPESVPPVAEPAPSEEVLSSLPRRRRHHRDDDEDPVAAAPELEEHRPVVAEPVGVPARPVDGGAGLGRQDELADLLAALSRSMEQLPEPVEDGPAAGAAEPRAEEFAPSGFGESALSGFGHLSPSLLDASPVDPSPVDPSPVDPSPVDPSPRDGESASHGGSREEPFPSSTPSEAEPAPAPGRRSRHSAPSDGADDAADPVAGLAPVTRPTFDAFSTAPLGNSEDRAPVEPPRSEPSTFAASFLDVPTPAAPAPDPLPTADRFTPVLDAVEPDRPGEPSRAVEADPPPTTTRAGTAGESVSADREPEFLERGRGTPTPTPSAKEERREESRPARPRPTPRDDSSRAGREGRNGTGRPGADEAAGARVPRGTNGAGTPDELQEDLGLTLASVLGEYDLPDVPMPPRTDRHRPSGDVAVPSARRHTSGSMPVPAEERRDPRAAAGEQQATATPRPVGANGRGRPQESGPRLADLLAEAMDAFRHAGPAAQDEARPPGVGSRRA